MSTAPQLMDSTVRGWTPPTAPAAIGPDMQDLWRRFPPRPAVSSWPVTEQTQQELMERLLGSPLGAAGGRRRWLALVHLLDWLAAQPGGTWQQRWQASGADDLGNAGWWRPLLAWLRPDGRPCGVGTSSGLRVCAQLLISADVIRPTAQWVMTPRAPQNLVPLMAGLRDPSGFTELAARCDTSEAGRTMKTAALRRAATILAVKGGVLRDISVGDCLELSVVVDGRTIRKNKGMGFYQLLHAMGVFGPLAPSTIRAFGTKGQLSAAQLIDRYGISYRPVRDLLVAYLQERQPMLDHTTMQNLALSLGGLFWADLERHQPGIRSLHLPSEVAADWKQRAMTKTRTITDTNGQTSQIRVPRGSGPDTLATVRAFYLDIAQWAMEDPAWWGPWAAPCPVRAEDLARQKTLRARKSRWTNAPGNGSRYCPS